MSTAAAPAATRRSALARAVETGELTAATRSTVTPRPGVGQAPRERRGDGLVGADAPLGRDDVGPEDEIARTKPRVEPAAHAPTNNKINSCIAELRESGPKGRAIAADREAAGTSENRRLALQSADDQDAHGQRRGRGIHRRTASPPATSRSVGARSSRARRRRRRPPELKRTRHVGSPGRSRCR